MFHQPFFVTTIDKFILSNILAWVIKKLPLLEHKKSVKQNFTLLFEFFCWCKVFKIDGIERHDILKMFRCNTTRAY